MKARWLLLATLGALMVGMMALAGTAWATGGGGGGGGAPIVVRTVPDQYLHERTHLRFGGPFAIGSREGHSYCFGLMLPHLF